METNTLLEILGLKGATCEDLGQGVYEFFYNGKMVKANLNFPDYFEERFIRTMARVKIRLLRK